MSSHPAEKTLDLERAHQPSVAYWDRTETIEETYSDGTNLNRNTAELARRNSLSLFNGPSRIQPGSKLPTEFRTLR